MKTYLEVYYDVHYHKKYTHVKWWWLQNECPLVIHATK